MEQKEVIKAIRLGKKRVDGKSRPLLLRLESEQKKNDIMGELKQLKHADDKVSSVGVSHDLTQDQRKAITLALDEARKQPQSENLKLKVVGQRSNPRVVRITMKKGEIETSNA